MEQKDLIKEKIQKTRENKHKRYPMTCDDLRELLFISVCVDLDMSDIVFDFIWSPNEDAEISACITIMGYDVIIDRSVITNWGTIDNLVDTIRDLMQKMDECKAKFGV